MDFRRLRAFLAVAEEDGFSAAARALHVSQPALSLAVRELEDELGTALFARVGRRVALTPAGQALLGPARQALRDLETARAAVAAVAGLEAGSLSLGALPTLAADPVAGLIGRFRRAHPGVRVDLAAPEGSADLVAMVRSGRAEVGVAEAADCPPDLDARVLADQELVVVLPPGTAAPARGSLARLLAGPLVVTPPGTSSRRLLEQGLGPAAGGVEVAVETAQREAVLALVLAGAGAALVPDAQGQVAEALGAVVRRPTPPVRRRLALLTRRGHLAPAAQRFCALALS